MNSIDKDKARNLYRGGEPLKNYQVYLDSVYWDSFDEHWQALQYIDQHEKAFVEISKDLGSEPLTVRIYNEFMFESETRAVLVNGQYIERLVKYD
jgi:hypothetical protein